MTLKGYLIILNATVAVTNGFFAGHYAGRPGDNTGMFLVFAVPAVLFFVVMILGVLSLSKQATSRPTSST